LHAAHRFKFDFYSLLLRYEPAIAGNSDNTFAHFSRPFAHRKHLKQPSGRNLHLLGMGTGSPFLVDPEGKPKDNISVSVNSLEFGWLCGLDLYPAASRSTCLAGQKAACRPFIDSSNHHWVDRSNPQLLRFVA
jgi:hypothetical protein